MSYFLWIVAGSLAAAIGWTVAFLAPAIIDRIRHIQCDECGGDRP